MTTFLAAAAAVVAIGTGGIVWQQMNDDGPTDRVEQIQAADDVQRFTVPVGDGGSATVYRSEDLNAAAIVTKDMPSAPSGSQYVLWLQHGSMMTPAGVMPDGADNEVVLSGDAASANGAAVSVEDAGVAAHRAQRRRGRPDPLRRLGGWQLHRSRGAGEPPRAGGRKVR